MPITAERSGLLVGEEDYRPGTVSGWRSLLHDLNVAELQKYADIARDQIAQERRWTVAHWALFALSIGVIVWTSIDAVARGFHALHAYAVIAAFLLAYWPYRSMRVRRLWQSHVKAVMAELSNRRSATGSAEMNHANASTSPAGPGGSAVETT